MLKTFEENFIVQEVASRLKRFVESVTGWLNKYRGDPFFRTETNVIALQIIFGLILLGLVAVFFGVLHREIVQAILNGVREGLATFSSPDTVSANIVGSVEKVWTDNILLMSVVFTLTTLVFGWVVARVTLSPARHALTAQKQFIGNIAHEIRTPLAIIKTNSELALFDPHMSAELKQTLLSSVEEIDRISEIIKGPRCRAARYGESRSL